MLNADVYYSVVLFITVELQKKKHIEKSIVSTRQMYSNIPLIWQNGRNNNGMLMEGVSRENIHNDCVYGKRCERHSCECYPLVHAFIESTMMHTAHTIVWVTVLKCLLYAVCVSLCASCDIATETRGAVHRRLGQYCDVITSDSVEWREPNGKCDERYYEI